VPEDTCYRLATVNSKVVNRVLNTGLLLLHYGIYKHSSKLISSEWHPGRSDGGRGGISVYIPPKSVYLKFFLCGCFVSLTHLFWMILKLQWLVDIYTHPNQIPGYATEWHAETDRQSNSVTAILAAYAKWNLAARVHHESWSKVQSWL